MAVLFLNDITILRWHIFGLHQDLFSRISCDRWGGEHRSKNIYGKTHYKKQPYEYARKGILGKKDAGKGLLVNNKKVKQILSTKDKLNSEYLF